MTKIDESNLHAGHRQSMFKKFLSSSPDSMPDHELLEMLLFYSIPRKNTNEIGHRLLNRYDSFHGVFDADYDDLKQVGEIGDNSATQIKLIEACIRRYMDSKAAPAKEIATTEDAGKYFIDKLAKENHERLLVLMLDNSDRIISCKCFGEGVVNYSPVSLRKLFQIVLACNAAGIYIAHNHPGGRTIPSNDDLSLTREIRDMCGRMDIDFNDHIIVAGEEYISVTDYLEERR